MVASLQEQFLSFILASSKKEDGTRYTSSPKRKKAGSQWQNLASLIFSIQVYTWVNNSRILNAEQLMTSNTVNRKVQNLS